MIQRFVVGEKYFTNAMPREGKTEIEALLWERDAPVNDIPTAPHPVSPKFVMTLSRRAL
jgi:hypothetical protein